MAQRDHPAVAEPDVPKDHQVAPAGAGLCIHGLVWSKMNKQVVRKIHTY